MSNKPTATLTDVKNKTGDVFALAEKNGAVVITSYNKPKYVISKYSVFEELESATTTATEMPHSDTTTSSETISELAKVTIPGAGTDMPIENAGPEFKLEPVEEPKKPEPIAEPKPEPKQIKEEKPDKPQPKSSIKDLEWWDRHNNLEQNWAKSVKSLL